MCEINNNFSCCYKNNSYICIEKPSFFQTKNRNTMNVPANLKYSNDHEWCRIEGDVAVIGITDFAQSQLGDIVFVDVPTVGETLAAGDVFGSIEAVKTVSDAFLPVGGEVLEFNEAVDADPSIVNKDTYGEGWLIKVKVADPAEYDALLSPADYEKLIG